MYTVLLCFVYIFLWLLYPFNLKVRKWLKGQKGNLKKIKEFVKHNNNSPIVWLHCSSQGEFEQGKPLLEAFLSENPEYKSFITFFSPSGYLASQKYKADCIVYLPLDTCVNACRVVNLVKPKFVLWIKYDFWKNFLKQFHKNNIPCYLVSANFRSTQLLFKHIPFYSSVLRYFTHLFVQTEKSKELLESVKINNVTVTGDTRFDRVMEIASQEVSYPIIEAFVQNDAKVIIAGSSWVKDELIIAEVFANYEDVKLIIVPHEINEERLQETEKIFPNYKTIRYTKAQHANIADYDLLIVDTMGMLSSIYRYAKVGYIGSGFDSDGIHNALEAAVYGIPVTFGPRYSKYEEAKDLVKLGGAVPFNNATELGLLIQRWYYNDDERKRIGDICREYVVSHAGTTEKILEFIREKQK